MTQELDLEEGRCLFWSAKKPHVERPCRSSAFVFQDCEWYFELIVESGKYSESYKLYMRNKNGQKLPKPFDITVVFIKEDDEPVCFRRHTVRNISEEIRSFDERDISCKYDNSRRFTRVVFIFHGDVGLTLQSGTNKDAEVKPCCSIHSCLETLSSDLSRLLIRNSHQDVELKCGERTVKAHRNILSTRSKVFQAMLQSDMVGGRTGQVVIQDMEADIFQKFLRYLYTGKLPDISSDNARRFYEAGDNYAVEGLMRLSADFLIENLTPEDACEILILADAHGDNYLKEGVIAYILDKKIPLLDDQWQPFSDSHPQLAVEVLNLAYKSMKRV